MIDITALPENPEKASEGVNIPSHTKESMHIIATTSTRSSSVINNTTNIPNTINKSKISVVIKGQYIKKKFYCQ
jgi:archaellum component FlaF (FlaF/FlaG flagellin family)